MTKLSTDEKLKSMATERIIRIEYIDRRVRVYTYRNGADRTADRWDDAVARDSLEEAVDRLWSWWDSP